MLAYKVGMESWTFVISRRTLDIIMGISDCKSLDRKFEALSFENPVSINMSANRSLKVPRWCIYFV